MHHLAVTQHVPVQRTSMRKLQSAGLAHMGTTIVLFSHVQVESASSLKLRTTLSANNIASLLVRQHMSPQIRRELG